VVKYERKQKQTFQDRQAEMKMAIQTIVIWQRK